MRPGINQTVNDRGETIAWEVVVFDDMDPEQAPATVATVHTPKDVALLLSACKCFHLLDTIRWRNDGYPVLVLALPPGRDPMPEDAHSGIEVVALTRDREEGLNTLAGLVAAWWWKNHDLPNPAAPTPTGRTTHYWESDDGELVNLDALEAAMRRRPGPGDDGEDQ